jgi:exodeoxyribonuclease VII small subunit
MPIRAAAGRAHYGETVTARDSAQTPPQPATDRTGGDRPAAKRTGTDRAGTDRPTGKRAGTERTGTERTGAQRAGPEGSGEERPAYEQARDELTELVKRLEAGGLTLEQSLVLWERGERLAVICEEWLEGARARLAAAMVRRGDESDVGAAPF